jgi:hypothetical protein
VKALQARGLLKVSRGQRKAESEQRAQLQRVTTGFGEFGEQEELEDEAGGGEGPTNALFN